MIRDQQQISSAARVAGVLIFVNVVLVRAAFLGDNNLYWALFISIPLMVLALRGILHKSTH